MPDSHEPDLTEWPASAEKSVRVEPGFSLADFDASRTHGWSQGRKAGEKAMDRYGETLADLQERLYAHGRAGGERSVLLVLQGMDTAGKGGIVRHVLGMVDPQGVQSRGFGPPNEEERAHHFLWRIDAALPKAGRIGVFDRSHYEDVLIARVRELVPPEAIERRYREINEWEQRLVDRGTVVVKVALMVTGDEQLRRLEARLNNPEKHWKYNPGDLDERLRWSEYMDAYQRVFDLTSTSHAPWHVVAADHKWYSRLMVTALLGTALESMQLGWPLADFDVDAERERIAQFRADGL